MDDGALWPTRFVRLLSSVTFPEDSETWLSDELTGAVVEKVRAAVGPHNKIRPYLHAGNVKVLAITAVGLDGMDPANTLYVRVSIVLERGAPVMRLGFVSSRRLSDETPRTFVLPDEASRLLDTLVVNLKTIPGLVPQPLVERRPRIGLEDVGDF